jgi:hypothetical protein
VNASPVAPALRNSAQADKLLRHMDRSAKRLNVGWVMGKPRRIHLTSQCYIRGWADNGRVFVQEDDLNATPEARAVSSVGWRHVWWGADAVLSRAAESILQSSENDTAPILRELAARWPLQRDDRASLAQFIAGHSVRIPGWLETYHVVSIEAIGHQLRRRRWGAEVEKEAMREFMSDRLRVQTLLKQVPRVASLLMSMQWSFVEFDEPLIASCDQPVIFVPRSPAWQKLPIQAVPRCGSMETAEVRFPIDPRRVLLLSWSPQPDLAQTVTGEFHHAADVNRSTRAQADRHWFHRPGPRPPLLSPPMLALSCEPISYELVPGYSFDIAARSRRRAEADRIMKELIKANTTDRMRFVVVTPRTDDTDESEQT